MRPKIWLLPLLALLLPLCGHAQTDGFNADSAYAYTGYLSLDLGPRPMGSANEQAALHWAADKFASFGADSAYVLSLNRANTRNEVINTLSGTAVGVFEGATDSIIIVGGHIDSTAPEHPGANDDASGTACVVELARVWSQRNRHYTLVFAAFGGEEKGLIGSKHFVKNFKDIDDAALMLQIDMAASDEELVLLLESKETQAPEWLVRDALAIDRTLGYNSLTYPVRFFSLNSAFGGVGSDHTPFIDRGIPAIDFTAGINSSPIHTQQDKFEFVEKAALARSGKIVDGLIAKYQAQGIPPDRKGEYMLWPVLGTYLFVSDWLVTATVVIAFVLGLAAFALSRKQRLQSETPRVRLSGSKLLLMMIIIAIFAQLGEAGMQVIKGLRYPWLAHVNLYLIYAAIWAIAGVWVATQLTRTWRFSADPHVYAGRALILLVVFTLLTGLGSMRLAFFPALTLILFSLAITVPAAPFRLLLTLLAPIPMFRLMFMEVFPFLARTSSMSGLAIDTLPETFLYNGAITVILTLWYLPAIYMYSHTVVSSGALKQFVKWFRGPASGSLAVLAVVAYGGYLFGFPAYSEAWQAVLYADARHDLSQNESEISLRGNEYFRDVRVTADDLSREYDGSIHKDTLALTFDADWLDVAGSESLQVDSNTVEVDWLLTTQEPWLQTRVTLATDTLEISVVETDLGYVLRDNQAVFTWYAEPPDSLRLKARLRIKPGAKIIREIEATYTDMPVPLEIEAALASVRYRTRVLRTDTLRVGELHTTQK